MAKRTLLGGTATATVEANKPKPVVHEQLSPPKNVKERVEWTKAIAARLAKSPVKAILEEADSADQIRKRGPVAVLWGLMTEFKVDQNWSGENQILHTWPVPGTGEKGVKKDKIIILAAGSNRSPEWRPVAKANGEGYNDVSFYRELIEDIETTTVERLKFARNALAEKEDILPNSPFASWAKSDVEVERGKLQSTLSAGAERLRKGMEVFHHIHDMIAEFDDVITIKLDTTKDKSSGKIVLKSGAIKIVNKENAEVARAFDATAFLRLNIAKAKEEGGTYEKIIMSGKSSRGKSGGRKHTLEELNKFNLASFENYMAYMAHYTEDADKYAALNKRYKSDDDSAFMISSFRFAVALGRMFYDTTNLRYTALGKMAIAESQKDMDGENADEQVDK